MANTVTIIKPPLYGKVFWNGINFVYSPEVGYFGNDYFIYSISDGLVAKTYTEYVEATNVAPLADNISLTANTSAITAISNDFGYSEVFVRQIEANCARGDLLFLITTSGKSLNILKALKMAQTMGVKTVLLSSILAKNLRFKSDFKILVPASRTDRIQELHIIIGHLICEQIEKLILK
jgi:hypothetical protein